MSDARWLDVEADVASAVTHFRNAAALYAAGGFSAEGLDGYRARMALMHSMQSGHTSAEAGLLRILRLLGEEAPQGEDWHYKLIERLSHAVAGDHARPALLSDSLTTDLHETRAFRHRVSHGYGDFNAARASPSIEAAGRLTTTLPEAIDVFKRLVDSD